MAVVLTDYKKVPNEALSKDYIIQAFADAKEDVDESMVIERMPSDWEPQAGSSIITADGDVAFLKSDGTWNWVE